MHQTKKGNQWHLAMKAHIGMAAGLVHTETTHGGQRGGRLAVSFALRELRRKRMVANASMMDDSCLR